CETYGAPLYLYAYHRTGGDRFAAEDIVQATLLAAVESISSYGRQVPLFAWLCGIARHKAADESRRAVLGLLAPYSLPVPRTLAVAVPIANLAMAPLAALAIVKRRSLSHAR
ncbi:MAG: sigma factor, partial [Bacillota bacterium]